MDSANKTYLNSEFSLSGNDFLVLSNIVLYNASLVYQKEFKSNQVPVTFIKFYIHELSGYDHMFDAKLRKFFDKLNSRETRTIVLMKTFAITYPQFVVKLGVADYVDYMEISNETIPSNVLFFSDNDKYLDNSIDSLKQIIDHYSKNDELRSIEYIFKDYLYSTYKADPPLEQDDSEIEHYDEADQNYDEIDNIIKNKQFSDEQAMKKYKEISSSERKSKSALLTGRAIEVPKQKGKVISIMFPELPLPGAYPTLNGKNRVNSERKVKKLTTASKELEIINDFRFMQVKYSLDFINKRKVIAHDLNKANRFEFDF
ncbi:MAG: hypothetical protein K6F08_03440 [bacterium]|nr:hypothetical protein [bacterium]